MSGGLERGQESLIPLIEGTRCTIEKIQILITLFTEVSV